jgi:hypothetical protein
MYYVGGEVGGLGGLIDASEMVDTYGCDVDEVRGFLHGGWEAMDNADGPSVRDKSVYCHISVEVCLSCAHSVPTSTRGDVQVCVVRAHRTSRPRLCRR